MLSSQQQPQFNHHHQFHQPQQQQLPPMSGAAAFCGSTSEIKLEPPTHIFIGANSGFVQQQQTVPPSTGSTAASMNQQMNGNGVFQQQPAMMFHQNGGSHNGVHSQQQQMININQQNNLGASNGLGKMETPAAANNNTSQPGAWFFSPPLLNCQLPPNQQDQELGSPCSPGLMAPHQLLARFGPRHCTESVEVPSSEHVAEIVGRQGCKIKALRAKTNTYIKTPVRGEEPFFVVTGRQEDVAEARREIECAAEHFTQIRASRRHSQGGCPAPGHVTAYVRVPLRVVGLVVGPKGNTIKRIQQDTHTYIITPSREREPIFEVTGLPQNVEAARREIENHIYQRTGNMPITDPNASIASYDLHAAALQAQQSMQAHSGGHRPNYGALAVNSAAARNLMQMSGGRTTSPISYQQSHLRLNFPQNVCNPPFGANRKMINFGGSERGDSSPNQQHAFGASANNLHMLLGGLELDESNGIGENGQQRTHQPTVGHQLLRSFSTQNGRSGDLPAGNGFCSATTTKVSFSPWNGTNGVNHNGDPERVVDFLDLISSSPSPLFASSNGCQSSFSAGSIAGFAGHPQGVVNGGIGSTGLSGHGGLSSVNSSSRDEGLGDSPTNSFGRPQGTDYQYQHLMTIWNDLVDQPASNGGSAELQKESEETKSAATTPSKETTSTTASATVGQQS